MSAHLLYTILASLFLRHFYPPPTQLPSACALNPLPCEWALMFHFALPLTVPQRDGLPRPALPCDSSDLVEKGGERKGNSSFLFVVVFVFSPLLFAFSPLLSTSELFP